MEDLACLRAVRGVFSRPDSRILFQVHLCASASVRIYPVHECPWDPAYFLYPPPADDHRWQPPSSAMRATVIRLTPRSPAVSSRSSSGLSTAASADGAGRVPPVVSAPASARITASSTPGSGTTLSAGATGASGLA